VSARLLILVFVVAVAMATVASATTIVVNWAGGDDFMTIQDGIDFASEGDTVLVMPGIYEGPGNTYIGFGGTNLVLKSTGGARSTVIDGQSLTHCFFFCGLESAASVVEGFTIINGSATEGAGMHLVGSSPTIRDCVFNRNIATNFGGGIYCTAGANPTLTSCTFSSNSAFKGGAVGAESASAPTFTGCNFVENEADMASGHGGAVFCSTTASPSFINCAFSLNRARFGGAVGAQSTPAPTFTNCDFVSNEANNDGGAMWLYHCAATLTDCTFDGNSVTSADSDAGGLFLNGSSPTITGCVFTGNTADSDAGAMKIYFISSPIITDCTFTGNSTTRGGGGAVLVQGNSSPVFEDCVFEDNDARDGQAAYCNDGCVPEFTGCLFHGHTGADNGGAMYFSSWTTPVITGCTFYGNGATNGGAVWCDDNFELTNCIIAFSTEGAAIYCDGDPPYVTCSDIYGNAGGDWIDCLAGMDAMNNNLHEDPLFCDAPGSDFTLDVPSPCTADNAPACGLVGAYDIGCDTPVRAESWGAIKAMYR